MGATFRISGQEMNFGQEKSNQMRKFSKHLCRFFVKKSVKRAGFRSKHASFRQQERKNAQKLTEIYKNAQKLTKINKNVPFLDHFFIPPRANCSKRTICKSETRNPKSESFSWREKRLKTGSSGGAGAGGERS